MSATVLVEPPLALPAIDRRISRDSTVPKEVFKTLKEMPRPKLEDYAVGAVLGTGTFGTVFVAERRAAERRASGAPRAPAAAARARPPPRARRRARTARDPGDGRQVRPEAPREGVLRGELFGYLKVVDRVPEAAGRFYAAQCVLLFAYLHDRDVVYRDLKPENLLLDDRGYLKLIDFSFGKRVERGSKTYTLCDTPERGPPAPKRRFSRERSAAGDALALYTRILDDDWAIPFPKDVSRAAKSLVRRLCEREITKRIGPFSTAPRVLSLRDAPLSPAGCGRLGSYSVKKHRFFWALSWRGLLDKLPAAPYVPRLADADDLSHFSGACKDPPAAPGKAASWPEDRFDAWG
ncbi:cAMP-dependent protein kinase [Aureococcus anophagefferens]|uniref:cAMP-dependent protein kinase n=1 Tax=Aureococcus anophagefferens TaxID=44056 RepID=A0ABR1G0A5_AURAN